jgi:hypothetical protein
MAKIAKMVPDGGRMKERWRYLSNSDRASIDT